MAAHCNDVAAGTIRPTWPSAGSQRRARVYEPQAAARAACRGVAVAAVCAGVHDADELFRRDRRGGQDLHLGAGDTLTIAVGQPATDRDPPTETHLPGAPQHRHASADAVALAVPTHHAVHDPVPDDADRIADGIRNGNLTAIDCPSSRVVVDASLRAWSRAVARST